MCQPDLCSRRACAQARNGNRRGGRQSAQRMAKGEWSSAQGGGGADVRATADQSRNHWKMLRRSENTSDRKDETAEVRAMGAAQLAIADSQPLSADVEKDLWRAWVAYIAITAEQAEVKISAAIAI